ncbi:MAG: pectate lyase [Niabella sp.]|nr:pectate lyase [Niabella sp.]
MKGKLFAILCLLLAGGVYGQSAQIDPEPFGDNARHWYGIADKKNMINASPGRPTYKPTEVAAIADNILLFQKDNGGWPKNYDMFAILTSPQKTAVAGAKHVLNTTFDNGTGYTQIRALAIAYGTTKDEKYKTGAEKGLRYILSAQYGNGGWPQYYPLEDNYSRCITYNDGAMEGIMRLLKAINDNDPLYSFVEGNLRKQLVVAYQKGIDCILKTQIVDDGVLTAWCQQYNEVTLQPAWARKFEPPSICNGESVGLTLFLMSINNPDQRIVRAVQSAMRWFEVSKIYNTRVKTIPAETMNTPFRVSKTDRVVVTDSAAPPIWTRYYELKTHRPLFCNRDSKVVYSLAEVERERRDGYAWYTYAPQKALEQYPKWQKKWAPKANSTEKK